MSEGYKNVRLMRIKPQGEQRGKTWRDISSVPLCLTFAGFHSPAESGTVLYGWKMKEAKFAHDLRGRRDDFPQGIGKADAWGARLMGVGSLIAVAAREGSSERFFFLIFSDVPGG